MPSQMHQSTVGKNSESVSFDEAEQGYQESTVDSETLDFISASSTPTELEAIQGETTEDAPKLTKANDEESTDPALKIHPRHDDSDLLIIEDEVDIHHLEQRRTSKATRQNSIDYKRMLKRMRSKC